MQNIGNNPNPKQGYFITILGQNGIPSTGFDNIRSWNKLMDYYYAYLYIISRTNYDTSKLAASISQIKSLTGGKQNKTKNNKKYRITTRKMHKNTKKTRRY